MEEILRARGWWELSQLLAPLAGKLLYGNCHWHFIEDPYFVAIHSLHVHITHEPSKTIPGMQ